MKLEIRGQVAIDALQELIHEQGIRLIKGEAFENSQRFEIVDSHGIDTGHVLRLHSNGWDLQATITL